MSSCSRTRTKAPRSARIRRNHDVSSSPAKIVADLDDVLLHILSFLPIKTLIKCKRVSKRWRSLITNPNFSNRIISSKHPLPISGLYLKGTRDIEYRFVSLLDDDDEVNEQRLSLSSPLRFADHPSPIIVMQSTNGLLLCKCTCPPNHFNRNFYVYNPTTKQKTLLPPIIDHVALSLAFDPSKSPHYKRFTPLTKDLGEDLFRFLLSLFLKPLPISATPSSGTAQFTAAFPEMIKTEYYTYRKIYSFSVIGFVKGETDAESSYIVLHIPNKAVKYYFISKTFKKLCSFEPSQDDDGFRRSFQFMESLANV
ncbi:hypothetical protein IGI04_009034 [Brassica rapa subsp. trilocularis]|uniref:F-box domain-containing protein n=1 Tax=Brassica rapa subsp. trilocularis TaxID=1813537 RepID=A0ABQ7MW41_BRACM|nr:hypothetical protein IGI04_009034 [Brassica rapa subsp. trilocularis]